MKKKINNKLTLYFTNLYPRKLKQNSTKKNIVTIGIGGNIGDVNQRFNRLYKMLESDSRFDILATSPLLKNPPFGFLEQDDFLNGVITLKTNLSSHQSLREFQRYENRFKRKRSFQDAPRTLDIDIIFFNDEKINTKDLIVPHPGYKKRDSVLIPLKFLQEKLW
jgi:2-amino-4-hydroxy-6-hydroxymethyldihydropteridine diphosphokinase